MRIRILLARPDHLGDVLLTLPAASALRGALPGASISYLVARGLEDVPRHCSVVDETYALPFPTPDASWDPPGWADVVAREAPRLRDRFDAIVLLRPNDPWSGALAAAAGIPLRLGYDQPGTLPFLTEPVSEPAGSHAVVLALHLARAAADRLGAFRRVDAARLTGFEAREMFACFQPTDAERGEVDAILADANGAGAPSFVLHPGSGWRLKNWRPERWGDLAKDLERRYGSPSLAVGGPGEEPVVDAVVQASGGSARALTHLTVGELGALHERARVVIGTDSGAVHLAAMVGAPVVGLYGPADPAVSRPWCPPDRYRIVRIALPCSPCGEMHDPPCGASREPACVMGITGTAVLAAVEDLVTPSPTSAPSRDPRR